MVSIFDHSDNEHSGHRHPLEAHNVSGYARYINQDFSYAFSTEVRDF